VHARVTTVTSYPAMSDGGLKMIRDQVVPGAAALPGFAGGYWLVSDDGTKVVSMYLFETADALHASQSQADETLAGAVRLIGLTVESVETYQVVAQA
jgi:hypothetical protein